MPTDPLIQPATDAAIAAAAGAIKRGELVGMPTETVYGLAANALDDRAVARVFEAKGRPAFDPLIVHVASLDQAKRYALHWSDAAAALAAALWPGPLTLVVEKRTGDDAAEPGHHIGDLVTAGLPSVALRWPAHGVAQRLIAAAGVPLAAPSANRFGRVSPTRPEHVTSELGDRVAMVLDGGPCEKGVESTVVSCVGEPRVLRLGGVPVETLAEVLGHEPPLATRDDAREPGAATTGKASPGMLARHYAPGTPLRLIERLDAGAIAAARGSLNDAGQSRVGVLRFSDPDETNASDAVRVDACEVLSPRGDPTEAAANLFAALRRLDAAGVEVILAERAPEVGLGRAINDRLRRGAG